MRNNRPKTIALVSLIVAVIGLTIAFAALSSNLTISGNAKLDPVNWNIYFDNIDNINLGGKATINSNPVIDTNDKRKIKDISVILNEPGDKVSFTVDLVNESDITAIIDIINMPTINYNFIEFRALYTGTNIEVKTGDVINAKTDSGEERKNIEISIYYSKKKVTNEDLKTIPSGGLNIDLSYGLTFVQSDKQANMPTTKPINGCTEFTKKDTYEVGDMISFCNDNISYRNSDRVLVKGKSEDFYVIKDNGDSVTALARYNLMVGNKIVYDDAFENVLLMAELTSGDKDYGLQSDLTKFKLNEKGIPASTIIYGSTAFANKNEYNKDSDGSYLGYWTNIENSKLDKPLSKYGESYPVNVFDENSLLWAPVQNYKSYFTSTLKKTPIDMKLITYDELVGLGCSADNNSCTKNFVYQNLNYWTSAARDYYNVSFINAYGDFDDGNFWYDEAFGVRPVITINKSEI